MNVLKSSWSLRTSALARQALVAAISIASMAASAQSIVMASTTSTEQSGLFSQLLPAFKAASGIDIKVVALGTGQALDMARRGDADVVFVHDEKAEEKFVADGFGVKRLPVMYNDFVLIGPAADPLKIRGQDIVEALKKIAAGNGNFVSRGDNIASSSGAYVLADRGTWLNFRNRADLTVLVEGDKKLFNQYGVMLVNPAKHPHVKVEQAQKFVDWVVSAPGQAAIAGYKIGGEQLFFPNARR
jgi:tungstate transport system substrate-binding protein